MFDEVMTPHEYETRMRCVRSLAELLETKPLAQLKARDVYERPGISKTTFYRHFTSLYSIAEWYFSFNLGQASSSLGLTMGWHQSYLEVVEGLLRDQALYRAVLEYTGYDSFVQFAARLLRANLEEALFVRRGVKRTRRLELQIDYASFATPTMVAQWFLNGTPYPAARLVGYLEGIVPPELYETVERLSKKGM